MRIFSMFSRALLLAIPAAVLSPQIAAQEVTFHKDIEPILQRTLLSSVPKDFIAVAESGVTNRADLDAAGKAGASAALVGTAIMRNPELLVELTRP